jgi:hypothetical protein
MEYLKMNVGLIVQHIVISILGWLLGIILGLAVAFGLLGLWRQVHRDDNKNHSLSLFIPWRTVIVSLLLLNFFPVVPILFFGIGPVTNAVSVAYTVFFLTIVIVYQVMQGRSEPFLQISSWIRTLAVLSVIITVHYGMLGGGGLGFAASEQVSVMEPDVWNFFWVLSGIALLIDEGAAVIELIVYSYVKRTSTQAL